MNTELIAKWAPEILFILYKNGALGTTITYQRLVKYCKFEITMEELMAILTQVTEDEYRKHGIFIGSLAVRGTELRYPDYKWFSAIVIPMNIRAHQNKSTSDICTYEKERAIKIIRELKRKEAEKRQPPQLW